MDNFTYKRRRSRQVDVGGVAIGGDNPIRLQSMTSLSTMDTEGCVEQCQRIVAAGGEIVRLTAQGTREAENIGRIRASLLEKGCDVPLVADIHFNPKAAFAAALTAQKVRINPGNFVDPGRTFRRLEFSDEEYAAELRRIDDAFTPFLELCRSRGVAIRLGVNHGSLSDRIMSRYGDTPEGMVESVMEFLRVCVSRNFLDVVISIKASNVVVMVTTVRLLVAAMDAEGMDFPLHLGVTEAGDGEDGRVKSAVGIGCLLAEGLGDTIRVSLSEDPECEIPVARAIVNYIRKRQISREINSPLMPDFNPLRPSRIRSVAVECVGGDNMPVVIGNSEKADFSDTMPPEGMTLVFADTSLDPAKMSLFDDDVIILSSTHANITGDLQAWVHSARIAGVTAPIIPCIDYADTPAELVTIHASIDFGTLLLNGVADGVMIKSDVVSDDAIADLSLSILQAARLRISKTEYISCPSCGRTLFDLQTTLRRVKEATAHLTGLKIAVMGCIVNGPGEMADADYGYVGAGVGRVSLYKGRECVEKNIPTEEAVERLLALIKSTPVRIN